MKTVVVLLHCEPTNIEKLDQTKVDKYLFFNNSLHESCTDVVTITNDGYTASLNERRNFFLLNDINENIQNYLNGYLSGINKECIVIFILDTISSSFRYVANLPMAQFHPMFLFTNAINYTYLPFLTHSFGEVVLGSFEDLNKFFKQYDELSTLSLRSISANENILIPMCTNGSIRIVSTCPTNYTDFNDVRQVECVLTWLKVQDFNAKYGILKCLLARPPSYIRNYLIALIQKTEMPEINILQNKLPDSISLWYTYNKDIKFRIIGYSDEHCHYPLESVLTKCEDTNEFHVTFVADCNFVYYTYEIVSLLNDIKPQVLTIWDSKGEMQCFYLKYGCGIVDGIDEKRFVFMASKECVADTLNNKPVMKMHTKFQITSVSAINNWNNYQLTTQASSITVTKKYDNADFKDSSIYKPPNILEALFEGVTTLNLINQLPLDTLIIKKPTTTFSFGSVKVETPIPSFGRKSEEFPLTSMFGCIAPRSTARVEEPRSDLLSSVFSFRTTQAETPAHCFGSFAGFSIPNPPSGESIEFSTTRAIPVNEESLTTTRGTKFSFGHESEKSPPNPIKFAAQDIFMEKKSAFKCSSYETPTIFYDQSYILQASISPGGDLFHLSQLTQNKLQFDSNVCLICFDENVDWIFVPCNHGIACEDDYKTTFINSEIKKCPYCRSFGTLNKRKRDLCEDSVIRIKHKQ